MNIVIFLRETSLLFLKNFYNHGMLCTKLSNWDDLNVSTSTCYFFIYLSQPTNLHCIHCHNVTHLLDIGPFFYRIRKKAKVWTFGSGLQSLISSPQQVLYSNSLDWNRLLLRKIKWNLPYLITVPRVFNVFKLDFPLCCCS